MYCSHCGKKLIEGSRFCSSCGHPVYLEQGELSGQSDGQGPEQRPVISPERPAGTANPGQNWSETNKSRTETGQKADASSAEQRVRTQEGARPQDKLRTGSKKKIVFGVLIMLLIAGIGVGGYFGLREYQYRSTMSATESALADRNYNEAITLLENLIQMRPEKSDNYLMLAQAHLELENLYGAKQALENGYAATGDETLQNVSLWGPIPAFEAAIWASESLPLTRQEYYFGQQDIVQGCIIAFGNIMFVMNYYFDSVGNVEHVAMTDYTNNMLGTANGGGVNQAVWETGWPFIGEPDMSWDYTHDTSGNTISAEMDGESIPISKDTAGSVVLGNGDEQITIRYNDERRPSQISFYGGTYYNFIYQEDGGCVAEYSNEDYRCEFDKNGLFTALVGDDADDFTLKLDSQNRVESMEMEDRSYQYNYSETGYLVRTAMCNSDGEETFSEELSYDDSGNLIQIIRHHDQEYISNYQMEYDSNGKLSRVTVSDSDQNITLDTVYEYGQDGRLEYSVSRHHLTSEEADDFITTSVPVYDEYGVIERYTGGKAVYIPGTYTGSADGFGGKVTVEVTVNYMQITNVEVIEENETAGIGPKAFETLISEMLDSGSPNVDTVTGATVSSRAFLEAVDNALRDAQLSHPEAIFDELDGKTFTLMSGVGNWYTKITFDQGGLFQGTYYDLNMGEAAEEYPNGTCYVADFNGTMGNVEQIDEYTYSMKVVDLFFDTPVNGEEVTNGVRYVEAPYDIMCDDMFELYCPGRSTADLEEVFMTWLRMPMAWNEDPEVLPVYGLFSLRTGEGFFCSDG